MGAGPHPIAAAAPRRQFGPSTLQPPFAVKADVFTPLPFQDQGTSRIPISHLAALLNMPPMDDVDSQRAFDCERLRFGPGDTIYTPSLPRDRGYIVLSGLALRVREQDAGPAFGAPGNHAFSGSRELIGLHMAGKARAESARAAFATEVLSLPLDAMRRVPGIAAFLSEWVVRPLSVAIVRDWQTACRLRELSPYPRVVEGLAHLARLSRGAQEQDHAEGLELGRLACCIDEHVLAAWLDLPWQDTGIALRKLERYHLIGCKDGRIVEVDTHALAQLSAIVLRHGTHPLSMARMLAATTPSPAGPALPAASHARQ